MGRVAMVDLEVTRDRRTEFRCPECGRKIRFQIDTPLLFDRKCPRCKVQLSCDSGRENAHRLRGQGFEVPVRIGEVEQRGKPGTST